MYRTPTSISATTLVLACSVFLAACGSRASGGSDPGTDDTGAATWAKSFGGTGHDQANAIAATADGGFIVAGSWNIDRADRHSPPRDGDAWLMKLDALGNVLWQRQFGVPQALGTEGERFTYGTVREASDGTHWAIGARLDASGTDIAALHLDASGTPLASPYAYDSGPFPGYDYFFPGDASMDTGRDIWSTADGGALLIGWTRADLRTNGTSSAMRFTGVVPYVVRIAADGTRMWSRHITRARADRSEPDRYGGTLLVREADDGGALATFVADGPDRGTVQSIARIDAGGTILWIRDIDMQIADFLVSAVDGDLVLVGGDVVLRIAAADGVTVWRRELKGIWEAGTLHAVAEHCTSPATAASCRVFAGGSVLVSGSRAAAAVLTTQGEVAATSVLQIDGAMDVVAVRDRSDNAGMVVDLVGSFRGGMPATSFRTTVDDALAPFDTIEIPNFPVQQRTTFLASNGDVLAANLESGGFVDTFLRLGPPDEIVWSLSLDYWDELSADRALSVYPTPDGGYIVGGDSTSFGNGSPAHAAWLVKFDGAGDIEWQRALEGLRPNSDSAHVYPTRLLRQAADGSLLVLGHTTEGARAVKLDADGLELWNSLPLSDIDTSGVAYGSGMEGIVDIEASDESFIVAATTNSPTSSWLAWLDASGNIVRYREVRWIQLSDVLARPDGYVLAGTMGGQPWASAMAGNDQAAWSRIYPLGISDASPLVRIEAHPEGGYVMVANVIDASGATEDEAAAHGRRNIIVYRLEADGALRWSRLYGGLFDEYAYALDVLDDGGIAIAGRSDSVGDRSEAWVLRLGPDGRIADGCNAMLGADSAVAQNVEPPEIDERVPVLEGGALVPAVIMPIETMAPARSGDVTIARQCLGTAQPGQPVAPGPRFTLSVVQGGGSRGVVTSTPQGIVCGTADDGVCSAGFDADTTVFLDVDPGSLARFARWEGCDDVDDTLCSVLMDADREVTVFFEEQPAVELTFEVFGNGRVQFDVPERTCGPGETCRVAYANGDTAVLTALPADRENLLAWGGDCAGFDREPVVELLMNADMSCTASFSGDAGPVRSLTIERFANGTPLFGNTGVGSVTSLPAGITCPEECTAQFPLDASVTVMPAPAAGWEFERFVCPAAGDEDFNQLTATIVMSADLTCAAQFRDDIVRIGVTFSVPGVATIHSDPGTLNCSSDCSWPFFSSTAQTIELRVEVTNDAWYFDHWDGCDSVVVDSAGGLPICRVSNQSSTNVQASFGPVTPGGSHALTIGMADTAGRGRVTSSPAGIECPGTCSHVFADGTTVSLAATPDPGSIFSQWRGDPDCVDGIVTIGGGDLVCEAVFLPVSAMRTFKFSPYAAVAQQPH